MKDIALVIMAAGIGSRYGAGIKQLQKVGPEGEIIIDYSIHDALEAGFTKVIFIIRKDIEAEFREVIGSRIEKICPVSYVFQDKNDLPDGFACPKERVKPWGTGQAVLACRGILDGPFAVINADDYYGKEAFRKIHEYMVHSMDETKSPYELCMAGFVLANTLSENGAVTRGVCEVNADGTLKKVEETFAIEQKAEGVYAENELGEPVNVQAEQLVSMNMWGLPPVFLAELEKNFPEFLQQIPEGNLKAEYLLPKIIDKLVQEKRAVVKVLDTQDKWFGVTYQEDKEAVVAAIRKLVDDGVYPEKLFPDAD